ncbi:DUF2795 domain-containing protein [Methanosarcina sp.]|uniref:DUF2795 domain-containing protein n=1 Tax=Methanosarcina sp. TaxID=2213 RepID=UPI00399C286C
MIEYAQKNNANNEIIDDLKEIQDRTYNNAAAGAQEFSGKLSRVKRQDKGYLPKFIYLISNFLPLKAY